MSLSLEKQNLIRRTWTIVQKTDAAARFYDVLFQLSSEAADVFKRMQIKRIFDEFDLNGDGRIQLNELQQGIEGSSNQEMNKNELLFLIRGISGQDDLDIEQFTYLIHSNPGVVKAYDVKKQGKKIFAMFDTLIAMMRDPNLLVTVLKSVGERHADYGVNADHFPFVANALMLVLEDALQNEFTEDVRLAWTDLFEIASSSMVSGLGGTQLTSRQKKIVKSSWAEIQNTNASDIFYGRLFTIAPSSAYLFNDAQLRRIFDDFDTNKDGVMQWGELKAGLARSYHVELNREAVLELIRKTNRGTADVLSFNDFRLLAETHPDLVKDYNREEQGKRIFEMMTVVVNLIDDDRTLNPVLDSVGERHSSYGVSNDQFPAVGEALLWTMEKSLGKSWNSELDDAWRTLYRLASAKMIAGLKKTKSRL